MTEVEGVDISILKFGSVGHEKDYDEKWVLMEFHLHRSTDEFRPGPLRRAKQALVGLNSLVEEIALIGEVAYIDKAKIAFKKIRWADFEVGERKEFMWSEVGEGTFRWLAPEQVEKEVLVRAL